MPRRQRHQTINSIWNTVTKNKKGLNSKTRCLNKLSLHKINLQSLFQRQPAPKLYINRSTKHATWKFPLLFLVTWARVKGKKIEKTLDYHSYAGTPRRTCFFTMLDKVKDKILYITDLQISSKKSRTRILKHVKKLNVKYKEKLIHVNQS